MNKRSITDITPNVDNTIAKNGLFLRCALDHWYELELGILSEIGPIIISILGLFLWSIQVNNIS